MKRVFTQKKNVSFVDYNNILNGNVILKNTLSKGKYYNGNNLIVNGNVLTNYSNYSTFLNVSGAYFRRFTTRRNCLQPHSITDASKSSVFSVKYNDVEYNNNNNNKFTPLFMDADCCTNKKYDNINFDSCNKLSLYPYGMFNDEQHAFHFPQRIVIPDDNCSKIYCDNVCNFTVDECFTCNPNERLFIK